MERFYTAVCEAINGWAVETIGARLSLRASQKAMLAAPDFVKADASKAAQALDRAKDGCRLYGARLIECVGTENGWLLFTLHRDAFDAYALRLPDEFEHETAYLDRRMELLLRHGDRPLPDCPDVLSAILTASRASARGRWTAEEERAVLSMTHGLMGMERVRTEHSAARAAKIILYERRIPQ